MIRRLIRADLADVRALAREAKRLAVNAWRYVGRPASEARAEAAALRAERDRIQRAFDAATAETAQPGSAERKSAPVARDPAPGPIHMLIWCPMCRERHIDRGEFATKLHHTHSCQGCGHTWRHAIGPTVGVQYLPGFKDEEPAPVLPPLRPAEDVAREMVGCAVEHMGGDWGFTIWIDGTDGRGVDLSVDGYAREESAQRDSNSLRKTIAALIERSRAEGTRSTEEIAREEGIAAMDRLRKLAEPREEAPSGMRIERRDDGEEYLIGAPREMTGCYAHGLDPKGFVCTYHFNGEHVATCSDDGDQCICERWPIAPAQDERRETGGAPEKPWNTCPKCGNHVDVDEAIDGSERRCLGCRTLLVCEEMTDGTWHLRNPEEDREELHDDARDVRLIIKPDADPRAVLAAVAELLGISGPRDTTTPDERSVEQIEAEASTLEKTQPALAMRMHAYARGIREGERRAKAKAEELVVRWTAHAGEKRREAGNSADPHDRGWWCGLADGIARSRNDLRLAFDLPTDGQPPTGGEPAPEEGGFPKDVPPEVDVDRGGTYCKVVAMGQPTSADERWQPGAVWESVPVKGGGSARFEVYVHRVEDGQHVVDVISEGSAIGVTVPVERMTLANGWRYVGRPARGAPAAGPTVGARKVKWSGSAAAEAREAGERSPARATIEAQPEDLGAPDWSAAEREQARRA